MGRRDWDQEKAEGGEELWKTNYREYSRGGAGGGGESRSAPGRYGLKLNDGAGDGALEP